MPWGGEILKEAGLLQEGIIVKKRFKNRDLLKL